MCGITPYDYSHIGHARTYIAFDTIAKYLRQKGYNVFYLQNITDVDDKIIARALAEAPTSSRTSAKASVKEEGASWLKLSRGFEKEYLKDVKALNIDSVSKYARATSHIKEIISQVERLLNKGYAYQIEDGIYYDISKFKEYGKLSKRTALQAEDAVSRVDEAKQKRNKGDFCLWKFSKKGEPKWNSPWGWGRPGWHIEDTAITEKHFGPQYDIHGAARDLMFPHHEAEIAQMEAISGKKPLAKYWLHSGFLTVKGQKMAKSLGNFITIKDFLKNHAPRTLRFFVLKTHYRSPIDYSEKEITAVKKQLERIDEFVDKLHETRSMKHKTQSQKTSFRLHASRFMRAMEDDFNTAKALAVIFDLINTGNTLISKNSLSPTDAKNILDFLKKIDKIVGFIFWKKPKEKIPQEIIKFVKEREKYRKANNWQKADELRQKIKKHGYWIEDTPQGPKVKKL